MWIILSFPVRFYCKIKCCGGGDVVGVKEELLLEITEENTMQLRKFYLIFTKLLVKPNKKHNNYVLENKLQDLKNFLENAQ